jgi:hypothetical protein
VQQLQPLLAAELLAAELLAAELLAAELLAAELLALQRHASERVLQQKVPEQDRSLQSMQRHAEAADDTTYPAKLQHLVPTLGNNFAGRQRQLLVPPRSVPNAVGGRAVEAQRGELGVVQDAGDEVAYCSDRDVVFFLLNSASRCSRI